jgi:hypothetical protein
MRDWEASPAHIEMLIEHSKRRGVYEIGLAGCSAEAKALFERVEHHDWCAGALVDSFCTAIINERGYSEIEALYHDCTRIRFGAILQTMFQVARVLTGTSPATIFSRASREVFRVARNVELTWTQTSAHSGTMVFEYPNDRDEFTIAAWNGAFRYVCELAGHSSVISKIEQPTPRTVKFVMTWN